MMGEALLVPSGRSRRTELAQESNPPLSPCRQLSGLVLRNKPFAGPQMDLTGGQLVVRMAPRTGGRINGVSRSAEVENEILRR